MGSWAGEGGEGGEGGAGWRRRRRCGGLQGLLLQLFVEQIIDEDVGMEEIFKVFSQDGEWVQQRFVKQNREAPRVFLVRGLAWVWWRRSPT